MPYFPVDDKLHSHPKTVKAGVPAMGLWTLCGSWSNDHGTDGFVPDYIVARFVSGGRKLAARLVDVGFWTVAEQNGERGWQFHEWAGDERGKRNYTRAEVDQRRREGAERQAKSRQRRASQGWSVTRDKSVTDTPVTNDVTRDSRVSASDPSQAHPKPISQNPVTTLSGPLTNQDHANGSSEDHTDEGTERSEPVDTGGPIRWRKPAIELPPALAQYRRENP